ncbi:MAG: ATP-binding cassette domain-containing protein, partial [Acinetobacter junii]
ILYINELEIKEGEKIAILGRNGSGKSSLLKALVGLLQTTKGVVKIDNININQLDPSDLRRDVTYLSQDSRLFYGSIRDNLTLGSPLVTDQEIMNIMSFTGIKKFIDQLPNGLDYMIHEGGHGLSGGQLQSLLLARTMLRSPNVILLDEPTASLDDIAEKEFVENLGNWTQGKTLIVATHRKRVLDIVDRIIIVSDGQIYKDQLKSEISY